MRLDDHLMTVLTGLVLAIVVGALAQNSNAIVSVFGGDTVAMAADDNFTVRAGRAQSLDLTLNDQMTDTANLQIVTQPSCGMLDQQGNSLVFAGSAGCEGMVSFSYCLETGEGCAAAVVVLNVLGETLKVAEAEPSNAPALPEIKALVVDLAAADAVSVDATKAKGLTIAGIAMFAADAAKLSFDTDPKQVSAKVLSDGDLSRIDPILSASLLSPLPGALTSVTPVSN